ncbi:MAG: M24 family metallopeptidase [Chloroflexi bacterium]|nr:M24 family metallopeptidase [Chloroflexota bacterium]
MTRHAELAEIQLPDFGMPTFEPEIPAEVYRHRLFTFSGDVSMDHDFVLVYADREHFANMAYLTGYDPRFEEALLIINTMDSSKKPLLVVGNEGISYVSISPIKDDLEVILYQPFSLMGQPRGGRSLRNIFESIGIKGKNVAVVGWKYEEENYDSNIVVPAYIADLLRDFDLNPSLFNATGFLMAEDGLRIINEVEQLARFEFAACFTSQALRNVLFGLQPDMTEFEAVQLMGLNGLPLSCHLMLSAGPRAFMGLPSPSMRKIARGEPFTMAYGVWGALNARAGWVVESATELPVNIQDYVEKLVKPYFEAIVAWYEHIGIGVTGGELYDIIHDRIGDPFFGVTLNPGHYIHLDEWIHSPIYKGSGIKLKSGMALQADVIPATGTPYFTTNIEDGIALADENLRQVFATKYPEAWRRIQARRDFMENALGIHLKPEVLPFSNIPAYLPPFLLSPRHTMRMVD